jgi:hypothetical protein
MSSVSVKTFHSDLTFIILCPLCARLTFFLFAPSERKARYVRHGWRHPPDAPLQASGGCRAHPRPPHVPWSIIEALRKVACALLPRAGGPALEQHVYSSQVGRLDGVVALPMHVALQRGVFGVCFL